MVQYPYNAKRNRGRYCLPPPDSASGAIPELPFYNGVSWDYSPVRLPPMAIGTFMVSNAGLE